MKPFGTVPFRPTRRRLLGGAAAWLGGRATAVSAPAPAIRWRPLTHLGVNIGHFWMQTDRLAAPQARYLAPAGVSFIRGNYAGYATPSGWGPMTFSSGVRAVLGARPYADRPDELELLCDQGVYAIADGEPVILSAPVTYHCANGADVRLPARTPLRSAGGEAGVFAYVEGGWRQVKPSVVRVRLGGDLPDAGEQAQAGAKILHAAFGVTTPTAYVDRAARAAPVVPLGAGRQLRWEIANYVDQAAQWLEQGFALDHSGYGYNWGELIDLFGFDAVASMREDEWRYFANLGWPPDRVLISDENEITLDMDWKRRDYASAWRTRWKEYLLDALHPAMRRHFPEHTLSIGANPCGDPAAVANMDAWPKDPNLLLRLHIYRAEPPLSRARACGDLCSFLRGIAKKAHDLGVGGIMMDEFNGWGETTTDGARAADASTLRRTALDLGWFVAAWAMDRDPNQQLLIGSLGADELWRPDVVSGAFGRPNTDDDSNVISRGEGVGIVPGR